jgi:hypothetical protein
VVADAGRSTRGCLGFTESEATLGYPHRNVEEALVWLTDCHIATYAYLAGMKKTAKCELRRQRDICRNAEATCRQFGVSADATARLRERRMQAKRIELEIHGTAATEKED